MQRSRREKQKKRLTVWRGAQSQREYTANAIAAAPTPWHAILHSFAIWLECERGLALSSVTLRVQCAREFVAGIKTLGTDTVGALAKLSAVDVEAHFVKHCCEHGPASRRSMQAATRLFLAFAASRSWVASDLARAVPSLRSYRLSSIPRGVREQDVSKLVAFLATEVSSARDRAIVLLCLCYGVRRGQVCALTLDDIDWRAKTLMFRAHKGGKPVMHTLTASVASVIAQYLQRERPDSETTRVFLRARPPHEPLGPSAVTQVVYTFLRCAKVESLPRGPHALRHAFAERLLRAGQPLKIIADLLGHRSLSAVSIYAKVDMPRLLEVAMEWPEASR